MSGKDCPRDPDQNYSEDDIARESLGPRGFKQPDPAKMTPERAKKTPDRDGAPEHTA
jgi:hypothetical protein